VTRITWRKLGIHLDIALAPVEDNFGLIFIACAAEDLRTRATGTTGANNASPDEATILPSSRHADQRMPIVKIGRRRLG